MTETTLRKVLAASDREIVTITKAAIENKELSRAELYQVLRDRALAKRRDNETEAQAFARSFTGMVPRDPAGAELFGLQKSMIGRDIEPAKEIEISKDVRQGTDAEADALNTWNALIDGFRRANPKLTRTQAHDEAMKDPRAQKIWQAVKRRDLAKSYRGLGTYSEVEIAKIVSGAA
jgi:hypothetical protein